MTVEQFQRFRAAYPQTFPHDPEVSPDEKCPVNQVSWFTAAHFCRWLCDEEHMAEEDKCYPPVDEIVPGFQMKPNYLGRKGYRLPTEAEWEYACRAGTRTIHPLGDDPGMARFLGWVHESSGEQMQPTGLLLPNGLGMFDMLGNAYEWCQDEFVEVFGPAAQDAGPVLARSQRALRGAAFHRALRDLHSGFRHYTVAEDPNKFVGFRIARTLP